MRVSPDKRSIAAFVSLLPWFALGCVSPGSLENRADFVAGGSTARPNSGTGAVPASGGAGAGSLGGAGSSAPIAGSGSGAGCAGACQIIATKCAPCHTSAAISGNLDLMSMGFANKLKGLKSTTASCMGKTLIDPASPATSLMATKISASFDCGVRMPPGPPYLPDADITCITQWLANPVCP